MTDRRLTDVRHRQTSDSRQHHHLMSPPNKQQTHDLNVCWTRLLFVVLYIILTTVKVSKDSLLVWVNHVNAHRVKFYYHLLHAGKPLFLDLCWLCFTDSLSLRRMLALYIATIAHCMSISMAIVFYECIITVLSLLILFTIIIM